MANSTLAMRPAKPRPDFPLFPHRNGRWAKKVRGKFCYFGKWAEDPKGEAAIQLWADQKDDLLAGRTPRASRDGLTVAGSVQSFSNRQRAAARRRRHQAALIRRLLRDVRNHRRCLRQGTGWSMI